MKDEKCKCGTSLDEQSNVVLAQSLLGGGMSAYCKRCNGLIRDSMNDEQDDVPSWIKERYKRFWNDFDPETF